MSNLIYILVLAIVAAWLLFFLAVFIMMAVKWLKAAWRKK